MDEPTSAESRGNGTLRYNLSLRRFIWMPTSLPPRGALILAIALACVAFISIRHPAHRSFHTPLSYRFDALRSSSSSFRSLRNKNEYPFTSWSRSRSNAASPYSENARQMRYLRTYRPSQSRFPGYPVALRTDTACGSAVEDFVEDRQVATGDCNGGRLCRARVIVTKQGGSIIIQAGYNILYQRRSVIDVDKRSSRNAKAVKRSEADKWARSLLGLIAPALEGLNCDVDANMISDAIMATKNDAARCPSTDNALCTQLKTIKTCAAFETPPLESNQQNESRAFLESGIGATSLDDLIAKSPCDVSTNANQVFMNVPLCKTMCTAGGCPHEKIVYADLDISGSSIERRWDETDNERTRNSIATVYVSLFNIFIGSNIPSCDDMSYGVLDNAFFRLFHLLVATEESTRDKTPYSYIIPQRIQDIAAQNYGAEVVDARYELPMSLASYIELQCTTMAE